jgi:glutaminyl-peptide cyclotransferase
MSRMRTAVVGLLFVFIGPSALAQGTGYAVVNAYAHDVAAFTQGLDFHRGRLYETTGLYGKSILRRVALTTGQVRKQVAISDRYFGEGMTIIRDRLWWITWKEHRAFLYDPDTFERRRTARYRGEGWGLTHDGRRLIMSAGTSVLQLRDPRTFKLIRSIEVTNAGEPVDNLNELEWVDGEVFANVWPGDRVARIDPLSGEVKGWIDLAPLKAMEPEGNETNGIAYLKEDDRLFVTGKNWSHLYEIELTD